MSRWVALVAGLSLALQACAVRSPRVTIGALAEGLDAVLASRPLGATQNLRADEVARTDGASYHVVQVRGAEAPHTHATHDLTVLVLRGSGTLTIGERRIPMRAGDATLIPRRTVHWFNNAGPAVAVALAVFTPPLDAPDSVPALVDSPAAGR
jgi:quercetin dioxygenase-like cupin family protein